MDDYHRFMDLTISKREKIMFALGILSNSIEDKYLKGTTWDELKTGLMDEWVEKIGMDLDDWNVLIAEYNRSTFKEEIIFRYVEKIKEMMIVGMTSKTKTPTVNQGENPETSLE